MELIDQEPKRRKVLSYSRGEMVTCTREVQWQNAMGKFLARILGLEINLVAKLFYQNHLI